MSAEENIKKALEDKFVFLKDNITIKRERRIFAEVPLDKLQDVLDFIVSGLCFNFLSGITGADNGETFEVMYHLNKDFGIVLTLRTRLDRQKPRIDTVITRFASAEPYERELADLLGIEVVGLPAGRRYPLPDDWPQGQHPLRKDWKGDVCAETKKSAENCARVPPQGKEAENA